MVKEVERDRISTLTNEKSGESAVAYSVMRNKTNKGIKMKECVSCKCHPRNNWEWNNHIMTKKHKENNEFDFVELEKELGVMDFTIELDDSNRLSYSTNILLNTDEDDLVDDFLESFTTNGQGVKKRNERMNNNGI